MEYTVREASKQFFSDKVVISPSTILTWAANGMFTPFRYSGRGAGPGTGSELNVTDLVTLGILSSFIASGAQYKQNSPGNRDVETVIFHNVTDKEMQLVRAITPPKLNNLGRSIQEYLEKHDYKVIAHWRPSYWQRESIHFYPANDSKTHYETLGMILNSELLVRANIFVNAEMWLKFVLNRL